MRQFPVVNAGGSKKLLVAMREAGFQEVSPADFDGDDRFFALVSATRTDNDRFWLLWRPKLVFTYDLTGENSHVYTWQEIDLGGEKLKAGTLSSERLLLIPADWYVSYKTMPDDFDAYAKAVADYSYRHILDELIAETAEWCGHMSSAIYKL